MVTGARDSLLLVVGLLPATGGGWLGWRHCRPSPKRYLVPEATGPLRREVCPPEKMAILCEVDIERIHADGWASLVWTEDVYVSGVDEPAEATGWAVLTSQGGLVCAGRYRMTVVLKAEPRGPGSLLHWGPTYVGHASNVRLVERIARPASTPEAEGILAGQCVVREIQAEQLQAETPPAEYAKDRVDYFVEEAVGQRVRGQPTAHQCSPHHACNTLVGPPVAARLLYMDVGRWGGGGHWPRQRDFGLVCGQTAAPRPGVTKPGPNLGSPPGWETGSAQFCRQTPGQPWVPSRFGDKSVTKPHPDRRFPRGLVTTTGGAGADPGTARRVWSAR